MLDDNYRTVTKTKGNQRTDLKCCAPSKEKDFIGGYRVGPWEREVMKEQENNQ